MAFRFSLPKQQGPFEFLSLTVYGIFNQPLSRTVRSCVAFIKADQLAKVWSHYFAITVDSFHFPCVRVS